MSKSALTNIYFLNLFSCILQANDGNTAEVLTNFIGPRVRERETKDVDDENSKSFYRRLDTNRNCVKIKSVL